MSEQNQSKSTVIGRVISDVRDKTRTIEVKWSRRHPRYGKVLKGRTKLNVHDEKNETKIGYLVEVKQCRPISKTKTWELVRVLEQSN